MVIQLFLGLGSTKVFLLIAVNLSAIIGWLQFMLDYIRVGAVTFFKPIFAGFVFFK
jgi:hypothetical protein